MKKGVFENFVKIKGKHLCQSLFFNKIAGLGPATLLKKRPWHRCFPLNFVNLLRTPFLQNTSGRLLLYYGTVIKIFVYEAVQIRVNLQLMQRLRWKNLGKCNKSEFFFLCCIFS